MSSPSDTQPSPRCTSASCPRPSGELVAIDAHAEGEPGRVIVGGVEDVPGTTMLEKMEHLCTFHDDLRLRMLREPRGYPAANCNLVLPPTRADAAAGFVIMEQVEYPAMSGSNTICVATVLIETAMVPVEEPRTRFSLDTPAGLVAIEAEVERGRARRVRFVNVPSFALELDARIEVPGIGAVSVDIAYGGMIYVIANAADLGLELVASEARALVRAGSRLTAAAREQVPHAHPERPDVLGPTICCLVGPPSGPHADQRNAVVVSTGELDWDRPDTWTGALDRSPCGTATCARMAVLHGRGLLALGRDFRNESLLGTVFTGRLESRTTLGDRSAVVPSIAGSAWITGYARYVLDPRDPFPTGYTLGDLWGAGSTAEPAGPGGARGIEV